MIKKTLSFALPVLFSASALAAPPLSDLAPESSVLIVGVKNAQAARERFQRTGLWDLWKSEEMAEMLAQVTGDMEESIDKMLEDLGLERDMLQPPTGELGLVLFATMNEELGMPGPGLLLLADYGENADKTAELINAAIANAQEAEGLEYDEQEIMGRTVRVFDLSADEDEVEAGDEDPMGQGMDDFAMDAPPVEALMAAMDKMYLAREGSSFILCSDHGALVAAFETMDGEEGPSLAQREDYQAIVQHIGENDAYAALLFRDMAPLVAAMDPMGMSMMFMPMLKNFIGDIKGLGGGVRLDGQRAMIEKTWFVHMPNGKSGLTALCDTETPRGDPPAFVGANAVSYTSVNFEFQGLPALINELLQMMPFPLPPPPADGPTPQEMIAEVFSCLGQEMHMVGTLDRPLSVDSLQQCLAVECVKEQEFENFVSGLGEDAPLEGRDFLGYRLYTLDPGSMPMMPPMPGGPGMGAMEAPSMSLGIGGGRVYLGNTGAVEQALRGLGGEGAGGLAEDPAFRRAVAALGSDHAMAWGYANILDAVEAQMAIAELQMQKFLQQLKEEDPELAAEMEEMDMHPLGEYSDVLEALDFDLLRRHIGPMVWEEIVTEDGFLGHAYLLGGEADE